MTAESRKKISYAAACREAARSYQRKSDHNRASAPHATFGTSGQLLWEAQAEFADAFIALAGLLDDPSLPPTLDRLRILATINPTNPGTVNGVPLGAVMSEAVRLLSSLAAGFSLPSPALHSSTPEGQ